MDLIRKCVAAMLFGCLAASPVYADEIDRFAIKQLNEAQPLSIKQNREYCGLIGYDASDQLAATKPRKGRRHSCNPGRDPRGWDVIATYHTHGGYDVDSDSEVPSMSDMREDFRDGIDGYIATPGGRVWLNSVERRKALMLCGRNCVLSDANFKPCNGFLPKKQYTMQSLQQRIDNDTGTC